MAGVISLLVAAILAQSPIGHEAFEKFDADRDTLLAALAKQKKCKADDEVQKGACIAAAFSSGTAAPLPDGVSKFIGVTWIVRPLKRGRVKVSEPEVQAMTFNKDHDGIWGAVTALTPQNAKERKKLQQLTKSLVARLEGSEAELEVPPELPVLLELVAADTRKLLRPTPTGYYFHGAPGELRAVGDDEHWVLLGMPREGEGLVAGVFIPLPEPVATAKD